MSVLTVFMVECSYVIQIFFGKNQDDTGTLVASPSHLFKFCPSDFLRFDALIRRAAAICSKKAASVPTIDGTQYPKYRRGLP